VSCTDSNSSCGIWQPFFSMTKTSSMIPVDASVEMFAAIMSNSREDIANVTSESSPPALSFPLSVSTVPSCLMELLIDTE